MQHVNKLIGVFSLLLSGGAVALLPDLATADERRITLIYSGNLNGELEPCGCTKEGDMGGIRRRATLVQQLRQKRPGLFLISSGGLLAIDSAADRIKNKYILKGLRQLNYDAIAVQPRDLSFGPELLTSESLPWVASDWPGDQFMPSRRITHHDVALSFFSWMELENNPSMTMTAKPAIAGKNLNTLHDEIRRAKQSGSLVVLVTAQALAQVQKNISLRDIDILLIEAAHEIYGQPRRLGNTLVLQPGSHGMRLGRADLIIKENRIASYEHQVVPLPSSIAEAASLAGWYKDYNAELKQDYLKRVELRKTAEAGTSPYAGATKCQTCHQAAYQTWQKTRHAHAFASLQKVNKSFDPNCIGCHSVGFEKAGGFMDEQITGHLMHVQCESCHGESSVHATSNGDVATGHKGWSSEKMCTQCHIGSHSPSFTVKQYWPKIMH